MCELFGFTSKHEKDLRNYLREFFSHSVRHPHGWGLATFEKGKVNTITEPVSAVKSEIIENVIDNISPQKTFIGHIRLATVGSLEKNNCHPFSIKDCEERDWTFAHNGTIFNGMTLYKYRETQKGSTDSERVLMYFIDMINENIKKKSSSLDITERCNIIDKAITAISKRNKLNILLFDGELFYVHSNMKNTLFMKEEAGEVTFGTVTYDDVGWENCPLCRLLVYKDGELIYEGKKHDNEYVDSISNIGNCVNFNL